MIRVKLDNASCGEFRARSIERKKTKVQLARYRLDMTCIHRQPKMATCRHRCWPATQSVTRTVESTAQIHCHTMMRSTASRKRTRPRSRRQGSEFFPVWLAAARVLQCPKPVGYSSSQHKQILFAASMGPMDGHLPCGIPMGH